MPDLYEILGVSADASTGEIKQGFRRKALECHPDTTDNPGRVKEFRKLVNAYEVWLYSSFRWHESLAFRAKCMGMRSL